MNELTLEQKLEYDLIAKNKIIDEFKNKLSEKGFDEKVNNDLTDKFLILLENFRIYDQDIYPGNKGMYHRSTSDSGTKYPRVYQTDINNNKEVKLTLLETISGDGKLKANVSTTIFHDSYKVKVSVYSAGVSHDVFYKLLSNIMWYTYSIKDDAGVIGDCVLRQLPLKNYNKYE